MKICSACNAEQPDDAKFCDICAQSFYRDSLVGKVIQQKYAVKKCLAYGGMSEIYLAEQVVLGQDVVIKRLYKQNYNEPHMVKRFRDEAMSYAKINHPNAVKIYDLLNIDGELCIVMEYVDGKTLTQYLNGEMHFTITQVLDIGIQLADALFAVHQKGIIHRDLKTDNVMLIKSSGGRYHVKILDLGIAKRTDGSSESKTEAGLIFGTPEFMSPEQALGEVVDVRTDIYSFGLILFTMLAEYLPFVAKSKLELLNMQVNTPLPPIERWEGAEPLPKGLEELIHKCCEKYREDRFNNFSEILSILQFIMSSMASASTEMRAVSRFSEDNFLGDTFPENDAALSVFSARTMPAQVASEKNPDKALSTLESFNINEENSFKITPSSSQNTPSVKKSAHPLYSLNMSLENTHSVHPDIDSGDPDEEGFELGRMSIVKELSVVSKKRSIAPVLIVLTILILGASTFLVLYFSGVIGGGAIREFELPIPENDGLIPIDMSAVESNETIVPENRAENGPVVGEAPVVTPPKTIPASEALTFDVLRDGIARSSIEKAKALSEQGKINDAFDIVKTHDFGNLALKAEADKIGEDISKVRQLLSGAQRMASREDCASIDAVVEQLKVLHPASVKEAQNVKKTCQKNLQKVPDTVY